MKKWLIATLLLVLATVPFAAQAQSGLPDREALVAGWNLLEPGGDTICARGTPYRFFVRPAESEKLLIHFQGGGACWDATSCSAGSVTFSAEAPLLSENALTHGIFDLDNSANPLSDYNQVFVSYCTGDIHTGNSTFDYEDGLVIEHKGAINARAVLDWVFAQYPSPEDVVVTGCSAGAYGSIYHADRIMAQYENSRVRQYADAGVGIVAADWDGPAIWNMQDGLNDMLAAIGTDLRPSEIAEALYTESARRYPDNWFSQFTTARDSVQTLFYFLMGEIGWGQTMRASLDTLNRDVTNFRSYIAGGDGHCIVPTQQFYTLTANGVRFLDWFTAFINGSPMASVACTDCETATFTE